VSMAAGEEGRGPPQSAPEQKANIVWNPHKYCTRAPVTPILYLSNGQMYQLADVKLEPSGTAVISVNDALAAQGIAPYATLTGHVEVRYTWPWDALCVSVRDVDPVHSLIFTYNLQPAASVTAAPSASGLQSSMLEGLWWKQEPNVTGFVSLSNPSTQPISATVQVTDDQANVLGEHTIQVSANGTKLLDLQEMQSSLSNAGGVRVTYAGAENSLLVYGGLEDPVTGFSASLPLHFPPATSVKQVSSSYVAVGMMAGEADPMMLFPAGTRFTPYAVVRNISAQVLSVLPTLYWMEGSVSHSVALPRFTVPPYRAQNLNLDSLISSAGPANFNGSANVTFEYFGQPKSLLMATGSVDQKNTYVFEVHPQGIVESVAKTLSYWSTADGDDTMVTLWNPADEAQDLVFTLFFSGGRYNLPVHLGPKATRMFNISDSILNQVPDAEGNIIPASVREGSAEITGPKGENEHILVSMDAGIYNVQKATCGQQYCITCQGAVDSWVAADPFAVAVGGQTQLTFTVQYHSGTQYDLTGTSNWSSSNTSIGTVSAGLVAGVSPGSLQMSASNDFTPDYFHACYGLNTDFYCPQEQGVSGGSGGTVQVPTDSRIVATTNSYFISSTTSPACPSGQAGWYRTVTKIVTDQTGADIRLDGQSLSEIGTITVPNDLNISSIATGSAVTQGGGYFGDIYTVCSPLCPSSPGETDAIQQIVDVLPNSSTKYYLNGVTIKAKCTGVTANGK